MTDNPEKCGRCALFNQVNEFSGCCLIDLKTRLVDDECDMNAFREYKRTEKTPQKN